MKIELMGKNGECFRAVQLEGISMLSEEVYEELKAIYIDLDKEYVFRVYTTIVMGISEVNSMLAMDLICNMIQDRGLDSTFTKVRAFVPKRTMYVRCFVNHFAAMLLHDLIEEEEDDEEDGDEE